MPSGIRKPATPEQIARFGHIAALFRKHMEEHNQTYSDFAREIGYKPEKLTQIYKWSGSKAAPSPAWRVKLSKVLGVPPDFLAARDPSDPTPPVHSGQVSRPRQSDGPVLQFAASSDGEARIRLDVTMPVAQAMPLLRILLDAGILTGGEVPSE